MDIIISSASAIAALLSALWASRSNRLASEALEIAKKERRAKDSNIDVYLSEIFSHVNESGVRIILANILFTNKSEVPDSISRVELIIEYIIGDTTTNVVIGNSSSEINRKKFNDIKAGKEPISISSRGSTRQWISFELPKRVIDSKRINSYEIEILSSSGEKITLNPKVIGELARE